jgi:hypothetical protein
VLGRLPRAPTALWQILGLHGCRKRISAIEIARFFAIIYATPVDNPWVSDGGANLWSHE